MWLKYTYNCIITILVILPNACFMTKWTVIKNSATLAKQVSSLLIQNLFYKSNLIEFIKESNSKYWDTCLLYKSICSHLIPSNSQSCSLSLYSKGHFVIKRSHSFATNLFTENNFQKPFKLTLYWLKSTKTCSFHPKLVLRSEKAYSSRVIYLLPKDYSDIRTIFKDIIHL